MNKKGIIALVVIIVLVVLGYMVWGGKSAAPASNSAADNSGAQAPAGVTKDSFAPVTSANTDTSLMGRLKSASVAAAETGTRVALVNGKAQFSSDGVSGSIALGDAAVEKTVGGVSYVVTTLTVTTAGTAAEYAALFTDANGSLQDQSYDLIGTGVTVTGVRADEVAGGLVATVAFKDKSGASHSKIIVVENGAFNPAKDINI